MITVVAERDNGGPCPAITREVSLGRAFIHLVRYELGFGGRLVQASQSSLTVRTVVFSCVDHTHFTGPTSEVAVLLRALVYYHQVSTDPRHRGNMVDRLMELTQGNPFLVVHGSALITGLPTARAVALMMVAQTESDLSRLRDLSDDDLFALVELVLDGSSLNEVLAAAA